MTKVLYLRVDDTVHERARIIAERTGTSITAVGDVALRRGLGLPARSSIELELDRLDFTEEESQ